LVPAAIQLSRESAPDYYLRQINMLNLKQPFAGFAASALVIAVSLGFISLFDAPKFVGWVAFCLISFIPMEIVVGVTWNCNHPGFAASLQQPAKGLALVLITLVVGVAGGAASFVVVGGKVSPPSPMLMTCTITAVIVTFWATIIWGGWPFTAMIKNPVAAGATMLVACYAVNYLLFRVLFDYAFMQRAPVYTASLDPHGLFNANLVLVFYLTFISIMFLVLNFDLWPFTLFHSMMKQPVLGLVWTLLCLALGAIVFYIGIFALRMDPLQFMVRVPIPFIFGSILVLNMLQGSLFAKFSQPVKGVLNALASAVLGSVLAIFYGLLSRFISGPLSPGPPANEFEIWLASALLGVTFPFLIFYADFFQFWQIKNPESQDL
jgi:hypothetical protein